jgi:hypothetical protein
MRSVNRLCDHLSVLESVMSTSKCCLDRLRRSINLTYPWRRTERRARMRLSVRSTLQCMFISQEEYLQTRKGGAFPG